ncbi:MAG: SGNH/GDSL hydrolase family protein [Gemmataceae bacterium]
MSRCAAALLVLAAAVAAAPGEHPPPKTVGPVETFGVNVQRSMNLIAGSTGLKRNTVRVLFYGQSHIVSDWTRLLAERLRRQYPLVDFVIENRAICGYSSELLHKTAEADLYPFYPDLVVFHDYGEARFIEGMVRKLRELTTADIVILSDHVAPLVDGPPVEIEDLSRLKEPKPGDHDPVWRSYVFLPGLAKRYGLEFVDVRTLWKRYLGDFKLKPSDLLFDDLHLNANGNRLMVELVAAHLRHRPDLVPHFADPVHTFSVGEDGDLQWKDGKLRLEFTGNKVELICREGGTKSASAPIRIDGKKPSEFMELYWHGRTELNVPRSLHYPPVLRVRREAGLVSESWTMHVTAIDRVQKSFKFRVSGSLTGDDGAGESGARFVSRSRRIVLEPSDFHLFYSLNGSTNRDATEAVIQWKVMHLFTDEFAVPEKRNPFGETVVVAAQGLPNGKHVIEIAGGPETPLAAIRVYRPPLPESGQK